MENEKIIKLTGSILAGLAAEYFDAYGAIFILVAVGVVLDFITGIIKAAAKGDAITSKRLMQGFWKKCALFMALFFGIFLDAFIPKMLAVVTIQLPINLPFGMIIGCYICIGEAISIFENIIATNSIAVPKWIKKLLSGAKKTIDDADKLPEETPEEKQKEEEEKEE